MNEVESSSHLILIIIINNKRNKQITSLLSSGLVVSCLFVCLFIFIRLLIFSYLYNIYIHCITADADVAAKEEENDEIKTRSSLKEIHILTFIIRK